MDSTPVGAPLLMRRTLTSTPSAAVAGILFAGRAGTSMVLKQIAVPDSRVYDGTWIEEQSDELSVAVTLMPFAAIAFLWFVEVVRDQLGGRVDRFLSTVFVGSGT
jgi:hypothetical protein